MKAYEDLTQRGKLRRTGQVARAALRAFGFTQARLRLMVDAGNTTYRVKAVGRTTAEGSLYVDDCYSLRLHQPGYQKDGAVDSELEWLSAMSEAGLPVPQPIPTRARRHYGRNGLWGDDTGTGYTADEVWPKIPRLYVDDFHEVTMRVEQVMEDWGKGPDVYGLIHADLGKEANVLFHGGEARAIDFDDGGYGYWVYDLAVPLVDLEDNESLPTFRDALLEGYTEIRSIPEEQLEKLELFQAAFRALEIFWGTASTIRNPDSTYWIERREKAWMRIKHALRMKAIR